MQPARTAGELVSAVFRLVAALKANRLDVLELRHALIITQAEAFSLLDFADPRTPWAIPLQAPRQSDTLETETATPVIPFDFVRPPEPGMAWAILWGVELVIDVDVQPGSG